MSMLYLTWERGMQDSWGRINASMRTALRLAIGAGLHFRASDFEEMYSKFRAHYWIGAEPEWIYSQAVCDLNRSAFEAWEEYSNRPPFFANHLKAKCYGGFIHANTIHRDRERLAHGFGFPMGGRTWFVTGFNGTRVRVALYENNHQTGKPKRLKAMSREELSIACPAPKKKATKSEATTSNQEGGKV